MGRFFDHPNTLSHAGHGSSLVNTFKSNSLIFDADTDTNSTESQTVSFDTDLIDAGNEWNFATTCIGTIA